MFYLFSARDEGVRGGEALVEYGVKREKTKRGRRRERQGRDGKGGEEEKTK